jgi:hypothetical protein
MRVAITDLKLLLYARELIFEPGADFAKACMDFDPVTGSSSLSCRSTAQCLERDDGSLPVIANGSAPALSVSRPARRSLALRPVCSPSHPS